MNEPQPPRCSRCTEAMEPGKLLRGATEPSPLAFALESYEPELGEASRVVMGPGAFTLKPYRCPTCGRVELFARRG